MYLTIYLCSCIIIVQRFICVLIKFINSNRGWLRNISWCRLYVIWWRWWIQTFYRCVFVDRLVIQTSGGVDRRLIVQVIFFELKMRIQRKRRWVSINHCRCYFTEIINSWQLSSWSLGTHFTLKNVLTHFMASKLIVYQWSVRIQWWHYIIICSQKR